MLDIFKRCFSVNLKDYENIGINLEINIVVLGAFAAVILGVIFLNAYRGNVRLMIKQLTRHGATSEDGAKTLKELGLYDSRMVRRMLAGHNMLTQVVARVGAVKYDYDTYVKMSAEERKEAETIDFDFARFYIKEEETHRAGFIVERYVVSLPRTLVTCAFIAILCGCVIAWMPGILNVVNDLISKIK